MRVVTDPADPRMYCHRSDALMADPRNPRDWHEPVRQFGSFFFQVCIVCMVCQVVVPRAADGVLCHIASLSR